MASRVCVCHKDIRFGDHTTGPVTKIDSLKFYENASMFGHPASRQRVFLCGDCTEKFIEFLDDRRVSGPGTQEVAG